VFIFADLIATRGSRVVHDKFSTC